MTIETQNKLKGGNRCLVIDGTHKGKSGIVRDINTSKTGHLTITVVQSNGERFKTLAMNVVYKPKAGADSGADKTGITLAALKFTQAFRALFPIVNAPLYNL